MSNPISFDQIPEDLLVFTAYGPWRVTVKRDEDGTLQITAKRQQSPRTRNRPIRPHKSRHARPKRPKTTSQFRLRSLPPPATEPPQQAPAFFRMVMNCWKWPEWMKDRKENNDTPPISPP